MLMTLSAIVATDRNRVIGKDDDIPWHLPADLKYFKRRTLNHHIIMGRKTFESIGRPLPKRTNIVVTRNPFFMASKCLVAGSLQEAIELARNNGENEAFIIGGGTIYEQAMPLIDRLYLTEVDLAVEGGEVFFPEPDAAIWEEVSAEAHLPDEKNPHAYTFRILERRVNVGLISVLARIVDCLAKARVPALSGAKGSGSSTLDKGKSTPRKPTVLIARAQSSACSIHRACAPLLLFGYGHGSRGCFLGFLWFCTPVHGRGE